jgi:tryptophanyl-tRNA synthetase
VIDAVLAELKPIQERAAELARDPALVKTVIADGCRRARDSAEETLRDVRRSMGLEYR